MIQIFSILNPWTLIKLIYKPGVFFLIFQLSISCFAQSGWIQQNSGTNKNLYSIHFENLQTGWCVGDSGKILKTTDAGLNWIQQASGLNNNFKSVFFTSVNTGYCVGGSGKVLKTISGGNSWFLLNLNAANTFNSVMFISDTVGFICGFYRGDSSYMYKTSNGGVSFDSVNTGSTQRNISVFFINPLTGWLLGQNDVASFWVISKTTDGGNNWNDQLSFPSIPNLQSVFFTDSLNGWIASPRQVNSPTIYRTTNGGTNWTPAVSNCNCYGLFFYNKYKGWASEFNYTRYTSDGGINWSFQLAPTSNILYRSVYFADSVNGWAAGDSGKIIRTTTGGVLTNFTNTSSEIPDNFSLSQNFPNPFNPNTIINYELRITSYVSLKIFDLLGNEVATLVNEKQNQGSYNYQFSTVNFQLASGIYFYTLTAGDFKETKRMLLIK